MDAAPSLRRLSQICLIRRVQKPGSAGGPPADRFEHCHRSWHSRGYIPHFDSPGEVQMITYRLADALPADVVREDLEDHDSARRKRLERYLDAGHGSCLLRRPEIASLVVENWLYFDRSRYRLCAWVVMPNHVHVLIDVIPGYQVSRIVHSWKSYTAKKIGRGRVWQPDYWDRAIRSEYHFNSAVEYIISNPVVAGLVDVPENWRWSSARAAGEPPALPG